MEGQGVIASIDPLNMEVPAVESAADEHSPEIPAAESAADKDPVVESARSDEEDQRAEDAAPVASSAEELRAKIIKQVDFYFSDENLPNDKFLMKHVKKDKVGFVSISLIASFRKMKKLTKDVSVIVDALRESSQLVVSSDGKKVKRLHPLLEMKDPKLSTVVVENLPEDHSVENIRRICSQIGSINSISTHDPLAVDDAAQSKKKGKLISSKMYALVEYDTVEAAEKAVATLNDKTDWRNGLRVQLLCKRMGYGLGRKAWRDPDSEKGNHARVPAPAGDGNNNHPTEQQDDVPDHEDGDHTIRERNGRKGQKRSKGRKYHSNNNGMGHGTATVAEASKPPPGPRMPDGTRGFTLGRGRPLISS